MESLRNYSSEDPRLREQARTDIEQILSDANSIEFFIECLGRDDLDGNGKVVAASGVKEWVRRHWKDTGNETREHFFNAVIPLLRLDIRVLTDTFLEAAALSEEMRPLWECELEFAINQVREGDRSAYLFYIIASLLKNYRTREQNERFTIEFLHEVVYTLVEYYEYDPIDVNDSVFYMTKRDSSLYELYAQLAKSALESDNIDLIENVSDRLPYMVTRSNEFIGILPIAIDTVARLRSQVNYTSGSLIRFIKENAASVENPYLLLDLSISWAEFSESDIWDKENNPMIFYAGVYDETTGDCAFPHISNRSLFLELLEEYKVCCEYVLQKEPTEPLIRCMALSYTCFEDHGLLENLRKWCLECFNLEFDYSTMFLFANTAHLYTNDEKEQILERCRQMDHDSIFYTQFCLLYKNFLDSITPRVEDVSFIMEYLSYSLSADSPILIKDLFNNYRGDMVQFSQIAANNLISSIVAVLGVEDDTTDNILEESIDSLAYLFSICPTIEVNDEFWRLLERLLAADDLFYYEPLNKLLCALVNQHGHTTVDLLVNAYASDIEKMQSFYPEFYEVIIAFICTKPNYDFTQIIEFCKEFMNDYQMDGMMKAISDTVCSVITYSMNIDGSWFLSAALELLQNDTLPSWRVYLTNILAVCSYGKRNQAILDLMNRNFIVREFDMLIAIAYLVSIRSSHDEFSVIISYFKNEIAKENDIGIDAYKSNIESLPEDIMTEAVNLPYELKNIFVNFSI